MRDDNKSFEEKTGSVAASMANVGCIIAMGSVFLLLVLFVILMIVASATDS